MRKYLIALAIIMAATVSSARAQVRFGVSAGGDVLMLGLTSTARSFGYGASAGLFADWTFSDKLPVLLRAEVNLSSAWEERFRYLEELYYDEDRTSRFISVPLMLGYGFLDNRLRITLGEEFSYACSVKSHKVGGKEGANGVLNEFDETYTWAKGDYNPWRTSIVIGAEYMVLPSLGVKVKLLDTLGQPLDLQDYVSLVQLGVNIYL